MKTSLVLYAIAILVFLPIDLIWLGLVAKDYYRDAMGGLLAARPRMDIGLLFYAIFVAGLVLFGVRAGIAAQDWRQAALWGGLFGFFCYATYDLTNLAVLRDYPVGLALVDMVWGTVLSAVTASLTVIIAQALPSNLTTP